MAAKQQIESDAISLGEIMENVDLSKLPVELKTKIDIPKVERMLRSAQSLSMLVTGTTGSGKSTLINCILGLNMEDEHHADVQHSIQVPGTVMIKAYRKKKGRIMATVWDTPGLQDGTTKENQDLYLHRMKKNCSNVDLTLFCIKVLETKFPRGRDNPDVVTMFKLTETFGSDFWNNAIVVFTFANLLEMLDPGKWLKLSPEGKARLFEKKIGEWKDQIRTVLEQDAHIPNEIVDNIKMIPAGYYLQRQLPDRDYWLSDLWFECMDTLPTPEARGALLQINTERIKTASDLTYKDFRGDPQVQPIVFLTGRHSRKVEQSLKMKALILLGCAASGGVGGATIGMAALAAGPIGAAIGIPAGFLLGVCVGLTFGVHKISPTE